MMLLNNDHGHPLPDAPVFYSVLSKNKQELRAAARANRMMKRFHLTIPYIIACLYVLRLCFPCLYVPLPPFSADAVPPPD